MTQLPLQDARLASLLDHYLEARGDRPMPGRRDIDALAIAPLLPHVWICEYQPAAGTFRYRLAGEEINAVFQGRVAGRLLSDLVAAEHFDAVNAGFLDVVRLRQAALTSGPIYRCLERVALGERLALPLSDDGETADGIIGATIRRALVDARTAAETEQRRETVDVAALGRPEQAAPADGTAQAMPRRRTPVRSAARPSGR